MRRVLLFSAICAAAWGQAVQLDCNQGADVVFTAGPSRANLSFVAQQGEAVMLRLIPLSIEPGFGIAAPTVVDQFGNVVAARPFDQTPLDVAGSPNARVGYEFDLPSDGTFTFRMVSNGN